MTYLKQTASSLALITSFSKSAFVTGALTLCSLLLPATAQAQRVNPMAFELTPSGSDSTAVLRVENTSQTMMTIELSASRISIDPEGKETREPAEDDFLIFPPQAIIASGKVQNVRVKYIGDPSISQSASYRVKVSQVPVDITGEQQSAVGLVVNFHTLATVSPKSAKADLSVRSIRTNASGGWDLDVENTGDKMARLSRTTWDIRDGSNKTSLNAQKVSEMTDKNLVLPGATLTLSIPAIEGMNASTTQIKINAS